MHIDVYGPDALLVRFAARVDDAAFAQCQALLALFERHPPPGLIEATPGFTTLLLEFEPGNRPDPQSILPAIEDALRCAAEVASPSRIVEIPVVYDGPDLERVAASAKWPVARVIERHAAVTYRVHLLGFAPGFAYLGGLDRRLHTPRLATPRPQVPAGSVAIGGEHTGIYPFATAGGWNLMGQTDVPLVDPAAAASGTPDAFLLRPGDGVRFIAVNRR